MERLRYNCLRPPCNLGSLGVLQFADGREVNVTAHVIREGTLVEEGEREVRQQMDVETEKIVFLDKAVEVVSGLRVSLYGKRSEDHDQPVRMFRYGERLLFPVKLHPPRNFRNPGAFDHQQYLADQGNRGTGFGENGAGGIADRRFRKSGRTLAYTCPSQHHREGAFVVESGPGGLGGRHGHW